MGWVCKTPVSSAKASRRMVLWVRAVFVLSHVLQCLYTTSVCDQSSQMCRIHHWWCWEVRYRIWTSDIPMVMLVGQMLPKAHMIPYGRSDFSFTRVFWPGSWFDGQTLAHTLESDLFQSTWVDFFLWGLCGDLYTRICCILVTFWRLLGTRQIMNMCSNASSTCRSGPTDKPWCKPIRLIHLDRFALEFCL